MDSGSRSHDSGTVVFLFTDLEGSTRLWEHHPDAMKSVLARHDEMLRDAVESRRGSVVKTMGDGLMAVFPTAGDGASAAIAAQRNIAAESWGEVGALRVRMGLHAGVAHASDGDYHGPVVNRTARIMSVAHGNQVLVSSAVAALLGDHLPEEAALRDLGEHRLKDLERSEHLFQLTHPDLPADFPPLPSLSERPNNLPVQTSVFIGRERQLAEICDLIASPDVRLLTLLGPGGTGKTRLALQAAAEEIDRFDDGVFFVDLAAARDVDSALALVARAVGLEESPDEAGLEDLARQLRTLSLLLVLDNFEQIAPAGPTIVELLATSPDLKVLVTSRETLRVRGEHVYRVPPLGLPEAPSESTTAAVLAGSEAGQLFIDRARSVRPDFELTDDDAPAVAAICAQLDGLPLAIELAAARLNLFSPQALLDRLQQGTQLLDGPRDLPARQQTLRATIEWSYDLLDPSDQRLFPLLSVFSGIGVETAEGVIEELGDHRPPEVDVIDGLASLVDKSLLRREEDIGGLPRFSMLATIREYATERLADDPDLHDAARRAHAGWFAGFAQQQSASLTTRKRSEVLAGLATEAENLRSAWRYWVDAGDLARLNELVDSLWLVYDAHGWHRATVELTTDMLEVLGTAPPTPDRTRQEITLLTSLARVLMSVKGYTEEVESTYNRALELAEQAGGSLELFPVLRGLASLYNFRGEFDKGTETAAKLLEVAERHNEPSMLIEAHLLVGAFTSFSGDIDVSLEHFDTAIDLMDPETDMARRFRFGPYPGVPCLTTSSYYLWMRGQTDLARERTERALSIAAELEHPITLAYARYHVGYLRLLWEEPEPAVDLSRAVLEVADEFDLALWRALGDCLQGAGMARLGHAQEGLEQLERGLGLYQGLKSPPVFWPLLLWLKAQVLGLAGRADEGLAVLHEASSLYGLEPDVVTVDVPQIAILEGELLLARSGEADPAAPLAAFERAVQVAEALDLPMQRLRAAVRICRLQRGGEDEPEAVRRLQSAYEGLTEGSSTVPAVEAKTLLDELL